MSHTGKFNIAVNSSIMSEESHSFTTKVARGRWFYCAVCDYIMCVTYTICHEKTVYHSVQMHADKSMHAFCTYFTMIEF